MFYRDLREFLQALTQRGDLKKINVPISTYLELTEVSDRVLKKGGPALLFERVTDKIQTPYAYPVLCNLFGTVKRVALGMGVEDSQRLREIGQLLAELREPKPPSGVKDALSRLPLVKEVWHMVPQVVKKAPCQEIVYEGEEVDLSRLPIQHCWPGDVAPLLTWGLTVTRGPNCLLYTSPSPRD